MGSQIREPVATFIADLQGRMCVSAGQGRRLQAVSLLQQRLFVAVSFCLSVCLSYCRPSATVSRK